MLSETGREAWRQKRRLMRYHMGRLWRPLFLGTVFIGITGSHGKTTGTLLLAAILRSHAPTYSRPAYNYPYQVVLTVLRSRPWRDRYMVQEVSGHEPGAIAQILPVLRPNVGVVTAVGGDHRKSFAGSFAETAVEKGSLIRALPQNGLAVLNADDPLVAAMALDAPCRVVRFGSQGDVDLRLLEARSLWPGRLVMAVDHRGEQFEVRTQLVGEHWTLSVMAALLTALELGVPRDRCLKAIETVQPFYNRMSVHPTAHDGWYVLDAAKSSYFGIATCLAFLRDTPTVPRRTVLFGTISDHPGASRSHYHRVARMALDVAERVIFTGPNAPRVRQLVAGEFAGRLFAVEDYAEAVRMLERDPVPGEIIYVKAAQVDALDKLIVPHLWKKKPSA